MTLRSVIMEFSQEAIELLDEKRLQKYSQVFSNDIINLDALVGDRVFASDMSYHALFGSLQEILSKLAVSSLEKTKDH